MACEIYLRTLIFIKYYFSLFVFETYIITSKKMYLNYISKLILFITNKCIIYYIVDMDYGLCAIR